MYTNTSSDAFIIHVTKLNFNEPNWLESHEKLTCYSIAGISIVWLRDLLNRAEYFLNILPFQVFFYCVELAEKKSARKWASERKNKIKKHQKGWENAKHTRRKCKVWRVGKTARIEINRTLFTYIYTLATCYTLAHTQTKKEAFYMCVYNNIFVCLCHYIEWENCLLNMLSYSIPFDFLSVLSADMYFEWNENQHTMEQPSKRWNNFTATVHTKMPLNLTVLHVI